tara:strand:+ start:147 stop:341 length:195 start_codon:yes stop_codon:yes gene_type:complete
MTVGDLVKSKRVPRLGLGLITWIEVSGTGQIPGRYAWVAFQGWAENDKWCETETLELISECQKT